MGGDTLKRLARVVGIELGGYGHLDHPRRGDVVLGDQHVLLADALDRGQRADDGVDRGAATGLQRARGSAAQGSVVLAAAAEGQRLRVAGRLDAQDRAVDDGEGRRVGDPGHARGQTAHRRPHTQRSRAQGARFAGLNRHRRDLAGRQPGAGGDRDIGRRRCAAREHHLAGGDQLRAAVDADQRHHLVEVAALGGGEEAGAVDAFQLARQHAVFAGEGLGEGAGDAAGIAVGQAWRRPAAGDAFIADREAAAQIGPHRAGGGNAGITRTECEGAVGLHRQIAARHEAVVDALDQAVQAHRRDHHVLGEAEAEGRIVG